MFRGVISILILMMLSTGAETSRAAQAPASFILRLPSEIAPETVMIGYWADGRSAWIPTKPGAFNYQILPLPASLYGPAISLPNSTDPTGELSALLKGFQRESGAVKKLKLLIYVPGYRIVTATFDANQLVDSQAFTPELVPLETASFEGRVVDSKGQPLGNQRLSLSYPFGEQCEYFEMFDCLLPLSGPVLASFRTKNDGTFSVDVPALAEDPFFDRNGKFTLEKVAATGGTTDRENHFLSPQEFGIDEIGKYAVITDTALEILSGRIGADFFALNGLDSIVRLLPPPEYRDRLNVRIDAADVSTGSTSSAGLKGDGSFELRLRPGEYDLSIFVEDRRVPLLSGVIVREGECQILEMPK